MLQRKRYNSRRINYPCRQCFRFSEAQKEWIEKKGGTMYLRNLVNKERLKL